MKIDKRLNLVIPIEREDGATVYVHSTPISADIFDTYFLPIAKTFSAIWGEGLGILGGPRIADKLLRKVSKDMGVWEGSAGVEAGLIAQMRQLTNVLAPGKNGWEMYPFEGAATKGILSPEDAAEVEAAVTFFTVTSAMQRRADREGILRSAMSLWGAQIESSDCTAYMRSLPTLTGRANSGVTAVA